MSVDGVREPPHDARAARSVEARGEAPLPMGPHHRLVVHARRPALLFGEEIGDGDDRAVGERPHSREMHVLGVVVPEVLPQPGLHATHKVRVVVVQHRRPRGDRTRCRYLVER